jgi:hypothetical protein
MSKYIFTRIPKEQVIGLYRLGPGGFKVELKTMEAVHLLLQKSSEDAQVVFEHCRPRENNLFPLVIRGIDIYTSEEDIKLGNSNIVTAHRLTSNGRPIRKVKITVRSQLLRDQMLEKGVTLKWEYLQERFQTEAFVKMDRITQCYKCQGFFHLAQTCTKTGRCGKCSSTHHLTRDCPINTHTERDKLKCANCGGNHRSSFFSCEKRPTIHSRHPAGVLSYAEVTALRQAKVQKVNSIEAMDIILQVRNKRQDSTQPRPAKVHEKLPLLPTPISSSSTTTSISETPESTPARNSTTRNSSQAHTLTTLTTTPQPTNNTLTPFENTLLKHIVTLTSKMNTLEAKIKQLQAQLTDTAIAVQCIKHPITIPARSDIPVPSSTSIAALPPPNSSDEDDEWTEVESPSGQKKRRRTSSPPTQHEPT